MKFFSGHGVAICAESIPQAYHFYYFWEQAAKNQILVYSAGQEVQEFDEETILKSQKSWDEVEMEWSHAFFEAQKRRVVDPDKFLI